MKEVIYVVALATWESGLLFELEIAEMRKAEAEQSLNPLNQVYCLNKSVGGKICNWHNLSLNPLNQVKLFLLAL